MGEALDVLSRFRVEFDDCLYSRADALFELTDAVLCGDGPGCSASMSRLIETKSGVAGTYAVPEARALGRGGVFDMRTICGGS
ncbi:hypothetical protein OG937_01730 [Streptomyces sp. NBC_00510]